MSTNWRGARVFTVSELIEKLKTLPGNYGVVLEGCDCVGEWNGEIDTHEDDYYVKKDPKLAGHPEHNYITLNRNT